MKELLMKPKQRSKTLLGITRSKAKMYEYSIPDEHHIKIQTQPAQLFRLTIGILGDLTATINDGNGNNKLIEESRQNLVFSAQFFDAYLQSSLNKSLDEYLLFIGAASYYLCDLPGSASVLASKLPRYCPDLECPHLEDLLLWLLRANFSKPFSSVNHPNIYKNYTVKISKRLSDYYDTGIGTQELLNLCDSLRELTYSSGTDRQLLFSDIICAIIRKRIDYSTWSCLPRYTNLPPTEWSNAIQKKTFIKELWPAQRLLGKQGVFSGKSAVIQMPTSAGKTKSTEIIIRSAFLSKRTSLAIIIAPFRALCQEIRSDLTEAFSNEEIDIDEPSDAFQMDVDIIELFKSLKIEQRKQILVLTPEKFLYILRHTPELADKIGLLIYDEGHQFDSGTRGITYELLLSSLKTKVSPTTQSILISAVISNAEDIAHWLNGEDSQIISGSKLLPTYRTLAFTSWKDQLGQLKFVDQKSPENQEFFVPRVIEQHQLSLKGRETKQRHFPEKSNGKDIALYLGIKLVANGSIAIFCGTKNTVTSLCKRAIEIYSRGITYPKPLEVSYTPEISKLHYLHKCHFNENDPVTLAAKMGVFSHSNNTPQGLRLAIEYAMQNDYVKFVICTSTLAQGVNLPIRYLIVTSIYQAGSQIKTRDFHNLIGRAGRAGMHTEGSIIFADTSIYDEKNNYGKSWRWEQTKKILDPKNSEPCISSLLSVFDPIYNDKKDDYIDTAPLGIARFYLENPKAELSKLAQAIVSRSQGYTIDNVTRQIENKIHIISSIESYLMSHWDDEHKSFSSDGVYELATETLAYYLANKEQRKEIIELFTLLAKNLEKNIPSPDKRHVFGRTLLGVHDSIEIQKWVSDNIEKLKITDNDNDLLETLWETVTSHINNKTFNKCKPKPDCHSFVFDWVNGLSFKEIHNNLLKSGAYIQAKTQTRKLKIEHIIELTENSLAYEGTLILGAIAEVISFLEGKESEIVIRINALQKRLKYGLPSKASIILYELGFSDRVIALELSENLDNNNKTQMIKDLRKSKKNHKLLEKYPAYYTNVLDDVLDNA